MGLGLHVSAPAHAARAQMEPTALETVHHLRGRGPHLRRAGMGRSERLCRRAVCAEFGGEFGVCVVFVAGLSVQYEDSGHGAG